MPQPPPSPEPAAREVRRPGRHISLADLEATIGDDVPSLSDLRDMDYLDAQLGLMAPGTEPAPPPKPRPWLGHHRAPAQEARELPPEVPAVPVRVSRDLSAPRASGAVSSAVPWAIGFTVVALGSAVLTHLLAPSAVPGYSAAEFDLTVQMRAVEWLLAGVISALVGLLLKR